MTYRPSRRVFLGGTLGVLLVRRTDAAGVGETTVEIGQGKLRGYRNGDIHVFKVSATARHQRARNAFRRHGLRRRGRAFATQPSMGRRVSKPLPASISRRTFPPTFRR